MPLPSLVSASLSVTLSRLDFISDEGSLGLSVMCLEFSKLTRNTRFVLKLLLCPQGEQGEDGKAEGPPGPPGDRVRLPNFHALDQGGAQPHVVWGGEAEQG